MDSIFMEIKTPDGRRLNNAEIKEIINITYPKSNILIISDDNKDIVYQILSLIEEYGLDKTIDLMRGNSILTPAQLSRGEITKKQIDEGILFGSDGFIDTYKSYRTNAQIIKEPELTGQGAEDCPKCKSNNTTSYTRQMRSADENQTVFNNCKVCKYKWRR